MNECQHEHLQSKKLEKEFLGKKFIFTAQFCDDCGATIWTEDLNKEFYAWINKANFDRNKLTVQLKLSTAAVECLDELERTYFPGAKRTPLLRALTLVYLDKIAPDERKASLLERVNEMPISTSFNNAEKHPVKVEFKPRAMLDIADWCDALDVTPAQLLEEVIYRMLGLIFETDQELKDFWKKNVLPEIQFAMKIA